jgi:hypothetical protein
MSRRHRRRRIPLKGQPSPNKKQSQAATLKVPAVAIE